MSYSGSYYHYLALRLRLRELTIREFWRYLTSWKKKYVCYQLNYLSISGGTEHTHLLTYGDSTALYVSDNLFLAFS